MNYDALMLFGSMPASKRIRNRLAAVASLILLASGSAIGAASVPPSSGIEVAQDQVRSAATLDLADCGLSRAERELLERLASVPRQQRSQLRCDRTLHAFARQRGMDMARRGYFAHMTPERVGPNDLLRDTGYPLPSLYPGLIGNSVEAIVAGYDDAERVLTELLASPPHRRHVLGEEPFFRRQNEIAVAHVHDPESEFGDYWVIVMARRERADEPRYACSPAPSICFQVGPRRR